MRELFEALSDGVVAGLDRQKILEVHSSDPTAASVMKKFLGNLTAMEQDGLGRKFYIVRDEDDAGIAYNLIYASPARYEAFKTLHGLPSAQKGHHASLTARFNTKTGSVCVVKDDTQMDYQTAQIVPAFASVLRWLGKAAPQREADIQKFLHPHIAAITKLSISK